MGEVLASGSAAVAVPADDAEPPTAVVPLPAYGQRGSADLTVSTLQQPAGDNHSHCSRHPAYQDAQVDRSWLDLNYVQRMI